MLNLSNRVKIGQRIVAGFPGTEPNEDFLRLVREYKVGNVILFKHNIVDEDQLNNLCAKLSSFIEQETGFKPFITIDQEGGVVTRLPDEETNVPGAMAIAATGDPQNAYRMGYITAAKLRKCGINFDLAPDMDVNCNPDNPVIGVRSYGDDPEKVASFGTAMIKGLLDGGVYCCVKHFPGHGDTAVDSHIGLPCIDKSLEQLEQLELVPFKAGIAAGVPAVMSTHILFPQIEKNLVPATMSRTIMTGLLREKLGFDGLIISDCMEMQAIQSFFGTTNGVVAAMDAGIDLVFISHTPKLAMEAIEKVEAALEEGRLKADEMDSSVERILLHKRRCAAMSPKGAVPDEGALRQSVRAMREKSVTAVNIPQGDIPALGDNPLFLGCPDYRTTLAQNSSSSGFTFAEELQKRAGIGEALVTPKDPNDFEIADIVKKAKEHSCVVFGMYNGHILKGQIRLAKALADTGVKMIAVALRDPYDLADLPSNVATLAAWEYTRPMFDALWPVIAGKTAPTGRLPLSRLK
jgi:beta-N-acetylhexosaminidase